MRVASCLLMCVVFASYVHAKLFVDRLVEFRTLGLTGRIVNGTKAFSTQFPHQVSLKRTTSDRHFCGGNIISDRLILTAAHCMYLRSTIIEPWTILVVAGELKLNEKTPDGQRRGVKNIIIHPKYNTTTYENDIAILELSIPLAFTSKVHSTCLSTSAPKPQTKCLVSGWGYTASDIPIESVDLMYVELPIREPQECRELLVNVTEMYPGMLCAGYLEGGKDACQGDSGGGMVCNNILTGIVSAGDGCAVPLLPGVYSNVFYYKDWVQSYIEAKGSLVRIHCGPNSCAHIMPSIMIICLFVVSAIMIGP